VNDYEIGNLYIIRVMEDDVLLRADKLVELEETLNKDARARLEHIIGPISAAIAFLYDQQLVNELEKRGYELIPQQRTKMIEWERDKKAG